MVEVRGLRAQGMLPGLGLLHYQNFESSHVLGESTSAPQLGVCPKAAGSLDHTFLESTFR